MTTRVLLETLRAAGVVLSADDGRLRCTAPAGVLTPALREEIARHRDDLVRVLALARRPEALPPPPEPGTPFALSHPQQRIWFLDQLAGGQAAYVIPAAIYVRGALAVGDLRRAIDAVVARHDALRTGIAATDGAPVQSVHAAVQVEFPVVSLEQLPEGRRREEAERRTSDAASQPFDLERPPLFRTGLFRLAAEEHLWFLCIHHIIADGTSLRLLLDEVLDVYAGLRAGSVERRAPLDVQYGSFVAWQRERLASGAFAPMQEYWRGTLDGVTPLNLLPDRPRAADRRFDGRAELLSVPAAVTDRLKALARDRGASLYAVLFTAFQVLMARSAAQRDVAVGTAMANRDRPEFEPLIGCLANTVVIRSDVDGALPFVELLSRVQARVREAWANQQMPFEQLVELLKQRDAGRNPLFDVFFALNVPIAATTRAGLRLEPTFVRPQAAKFELALFAEETPEGLKGLLEYQTDLWDASSVRRLARRFAVLLQGIADDPATPVGQLPVLDAAERKTIEGGWRRSRQPSSGRDTIHDLVRAQASRSPHAVAAVFEERQLTYEQLERRAGVVARRLGARGIGRGQLIGLSFERSLEMLVALLGVLKAGAAYVPLDTAFPVDRLRFIAEDSGLDAVLTSFQGPSAEVHRTQCCAVLPESTPRLLLEDLEAPDGLDDTPVVDPVSGPDDLAYVLYTSGSTGRPKGVEVTHGNVVNFLQSMAREPGLSSRDVLLAVTTLSFDIAVLELFLPWVVGARTVVAAREVAADGARLAEALAGCGATVMQATPATWRMLLEAGYRPGPGMTVLCGGEALPARLAAELTATGAAVWNLYGPTETTVWSAVARVVPGRPPDLGLPVANTQLYVLDAELQPAPIGVPGDIYIGGAGVARGYRRRPDLTSARFLPDPFADAPGARMYQTGDRGALAADGTLRYLGRSDDQLKVRGFRIEPGEIEATLGRHMGVQQVVVIGQRVRDDDVRLVAYVQCGPDDFSPESFRRFLSDRLPSYMIPSAFARIDEFPSTPNGKVDRAALAVHARDLASAPAAVVESVAPRDELEAAIAAIWRDVLGVERVGVHDSFFELGGHSLLAARVVSRVEAGLGVRLPINLFAARPTVAEHAQFVAAERTGREARTAGLLEWIEGLSERDAARYLESL